MGVPVDEWIEGGEVDGGGIDAAGPGVQGLVTGVEAEESVLLADEVEDGEIGEGAPENAGAEVVEHDADCPTGERNENEERAVFFASGVIEVGAVEGGV